MNELCENLEAQGYTIESKLSSGAHGTCYMVRKNGVCYILKDYDINSQSESMHETKVYQMLHGDGMGNEYFFKAEHLEIDDKHFLLLHTYEGETLESFFLANSELKIEDKIELMIRACKSIKEMHEMTPTLVHLDIKPSNLYLSQKEHIVKPIDMGSAIVKSGRKEFCEIMEDVGYRSTDGYATMRVKLFNNMRDELFQMEPTAEEIEDLRSLEEMIGIKDDIYSLVCCVFFALTGRSYMSWVESEYDGDNYQQIQKMLTNIPEHMRERIMLFFKSLEAPYSNEKSEIRFNTIDDLIYELEVIKEIARLKGFHEEVLLTKSKNYLDKNLYKLISPDNGFDKELIPAIKK